MSYVDGFIVPVPKAKLAEYRKLARLAKTVWMEHGARAYLESLADDAPVGKLTSFPRSVKLQEDEVVVFSYILYDSRAHRDRVNKRAMADPRLAKMEPKTMPFDGKRMIWGGFKVFVQA